MSGFFKEWLDEYEQRIHPLRDADDDGDEALDYDDEYNQHLEALHGAVSVDPYLLDAAPDLLKACKVAANWVREYHTQLGSPADDGMASLEQEILAAIKKAKGYEQTNER